MPSGIARWLSCAWYRNTAPPLILRPAGWLYGRIIAARRALYGRGWLASAHPGRPVLVVGNLTVGGTGKTPLTAWLARRLRTRGLRVGIISRGYGRRGEELRRVERDSHWQEVGDEPLLLHAQTGCPVFVARDRLQAARALCAEGVDIIIADDGLQHLPLRRDCELLVVDGARGFGNGWLLPAGPLREPLERARTVDAIVVHGTARHASLTALEGSPGPPRLGMQLAAGDARSVGGLVPDRPLESFRAQTVHAVAGIGDPGRFFRELRARGLTIHEHAFADHHGFTPAELDFGDELAVLMTEKDAVKCRSFAHERLWFVPVTAALDESAAHELLERVLTKLGV